MNKSTLALTLSLALAPAAQLLAANSSFSSHELSTGYQLAAAETTETTVTKAHEGKCGEGKCGADRKAHQGNAGADKTAEAKCGANKTPEAKCGADKTPEAKCGANKEPVAK